jgi:uncharacterized protein YndB with AHSA1/START domain
VTVLSVDRDPVALTLTVVSEFDAPLARLWQVWADPRQLERWWGTPACPATVVDHELTPGGWVRYYMTGSDGQRTHAWWRIISVDEPNFLEFEDGYAADGPQSTLPSTHVEVRLVLSEPDTTVMTITSRFASLADMEKLLALGQEEGMVLAVRQIDAVLGDSTTPPSE